MVEYRLLGRTGVRVAPLALGTDNFADPTPEDECAVILDRAMDAGIKSATQATGALFSEIGRRLQTIGDRLKS